MRFAPDRPLGVAAATVRDYRELARRRLPRQLFDYIDGGAYEETTMAANVDDLATAHLAALLRLERGKELKLNLGTGRGSSVSEVVAACRQVTGHPIPAQIAGPRAGDPPALVADAREARRELGWQPSYTEVTPIIETAWRWHRAHPHGYED